MWESVRIGMGKYFVFDYIILHESFIKIEHLGVDASSVDQIVKDDPYEIKRFLRKERINLTSLHILSIV